MTPASHYRLPARLGERRSPGDFSPWTSNSAPSNPSFNPRPTFVQSPSNADRLGPIRAQTPTKPALAPAAPAKNLCLPNPFQRRAATHSARSLSRLRREAFLPFQPIPTPTIPRPLPALFHPVQAGSGVSRQETPRPKVEEFAPVDSTSRLWRPDTSSLNPEM
jgi:hypothetical protein